MDTGLERKKKYVEEAELVSAFAAGGLQQWEVGGKSCASGIQGGEQEENKIQNRFEKNRAKEMIQCNAKL